MTSFNKYLSGGDFRSIAHVDELIELVEHQEEFDKLFKYLFSNDRLIAMRAIDAIEKITKKKPEFLTCHHSEIIKLLETAKDKEFKWHLAQLISRIELRGGKLIKVWEKLINWAQDQSESKIVRVNSLQALYEIQQRHPEYRDDLMTILEKVKKEGIASINARIQQFSFK